MTYDGGVVMIGSEWADWTRSPTSLGGKNTQRVHVLIQRDIDDHCARAKRAGAKIVMEPADQFYGHRTYVATDLEGHYWSFAQPVRNIWYRARSPAASTPCPSRLRIPPRADGERPGSGRCLQPATSDTSRYNRNGRARG